MRIKEILTESLQHIDQSNEGGSLEGYVVSTDQPQLINYFHAQGAPTQLAEKLMSKFSVIGVIRNLYIDDEMRGQGYGSDLLDNAIDAAFNNGAEAIVLIADTSESNQIDLVKWYQNYGFEIIGNASGDPIMILTPDE